MTLQVQCLKTELQLACLCEAERYILNVF